MDDDPYLWLEDITSEQALDWVRQNSETTLAKLSLDPWMGDFEWSSARFGAVSRAVDVAAHV